MNAGPLRPRFTHGDGTAPRIPGRLVVGRYSPSDIYFWGAQTGSALDTQFHFCHSAGRRGSSVLVREYGYPELEPKAVDFAEDCGDYD